MIARACCGAVGALAVAVTACGGPAVAQPTPVVGITGGRTVYAERFTDGRSGWFSGQTTGGAAFTYQSNGYVVTAHRQGINVTAAHFGTHLPQVAIQVTVLVETGDPSTAASGAWCFQGDGPPRSYVYMFVVLPDGGLEIRRYRDGASGGVVIWAGHSTLIKGLGTVNTLTAACRTTGWDGNTAHNQLVLAIAGSVVADVGDTWAGQPHAGWGTGLLTGGGDTVPTAVRFTDYSLRDLAGG